MTQIRRVHVGLDPIPSYWHPSSIARSVGWSVGITASRYGGHRKYEREKRVWEGKTDREAGDRQREPRYFAIYRISYRFLSVCVAGCRFSFATRSNRSAMKTPRGANPSLRRLCLAVSSASLLRPPSAPQRAIFIQTWKS